jgi:hypothetical protein
MSKQTITPLTFEDDEMTILDVTQNAPATVEQKEVDIKPNSNPTSILPKEDAIVEDTNVTEEDTETIDYGNLGLSNKEKNNETEEEGNNITLSESADYKGITDFLIEQGIWSDFDERESIDLNSESFAELWKHQAKEAAKREKNEEMSSYGSTANELMEYLKAGGSVEVFAQNFNSQRDIESISTEDSSDQEQLIREYYSAMNWSKEKINRHVNRLKDEGEDSFKEEAEFSKNELVKIISEERQQLLSEQQQIAEDYRLRAERFNSSLKKEIYSDDNLADREKKEVEKFLFAPAYEDKNTGQRFSGFGVKFEEIKQDPKKYYKLIRFIKDIDSFEDKKKIEKEVTKKTYNFLRSSAQTLSDVQSAEPVKADKGKKTIPAFTFK